MSANEHDAPLITEAEIALLLEHQELTPELQELIQQYQQAKTKQEAEPPKDDACPVGTHCAIVFAFEKYQLLLLPAIILDYSSPEQAQVLIITPVTKDTVPCPDYFSNNKQCTSCAYSHGYLIPIDRILPFEALETDSMLEQLQYEKKVWCKKEGEDIWRLGHIIDQLHGPNWRVQLKGGRKREILNVDLEHIVPFRSLDDADSHDEEWSESDRESVDIHIIEVQDKKWGSWQAHSTGFAAKMMKKMGYVEGKGLGIQGEGRLDPVEVRPYGNQQARPGLGLYKKKKPGVKKHPPKDTVGVFNLVNTLSDSKQADTSVPMNITTRQQANKMMANLQSKIDKTHKEYINATEAYRRNKGSPMENRFATKLKNAASGLQDLQRQMSKLEGHVKREKERQDMYTF